MLYSGYDLMLYNGSGSVILAACKGVEIHVEQEMDEVPSTSHPGWKDYVKKRKGWSFTISNLVSATTLSNAPSMVGTSYLCKFYNGRNTSYSALLMGTAVCTQAKITEQKGSIAKGTFVFQGIGPLT